MEQLVDRADAERPDANTVDPVRLERVLDGGRLLSLAEPSRPDQQDVRVGQPAQRETQRARRRGIEPLEVVDRDDEPVLGEQFQSASNRNSQGTWVDRTTGCVLDEECDLERPTAGGRQSGQDVVESAFEQIAQTGVSECALRLGRPRREDAQPPPTRGVYNLAPERRLADPGLALQRDRAGPVPAPVEACVQRAEVVVPADDFDCHSPRHRDREHPESKPPRR